MTGNTALLLYPMAALVALHMLVAARVFLTRVSAVRGHKVSLKYFRNFKGDAQDDAMVAATRHYANLFEMPVLFYAVCLLILHVGRADAVFAALAWSYVALRVVHMAIHLSYNKVPHRIVAFATSTLVLFAMWIRVVVGVATA